MAKKSGQLSHAWQRRERGTAVPLRTHQVRLRDGSTAEVQGIDFTNAEVPDKTYFGESAGVACAEDVVRVMFAQPKLGGAGLRSLVLISMSPPAAFHFAKSLQRMRNPTLEEIVERHNIREKPLDDFPSAEPEQTAVLTANMVAVAVHGYECCLDFYHANAFAHLAVQRSNANQIYIEPVVRVTANSGLLLSLLRRMNELISQFPQSPELHAAQEMPDDD